MADQFSASYVIGLVLCGSLLLVSWWAMQESESRLADPDDDRTLYLDQISDKATLAPRGIYRVTVLRQSGNMHAERIVAGSARDALKVAITTFRRAGIDAVHVGVNTADQITFARTHHSHRGSAEGKKVGKAIITTLSVESPAPPAPVIATDQVPGVTVEVTLTCNCGTEVAVDERDLDRAFVCSECGRQETLTPDQAASARADLTEARQAARRRIEAGASADEVVRELAGDAAIRRTGSSSRIRR